MTQTPSDRHFMQAALGLGRRAAGRVWPNPAVGCVLVNGGHVVGRGHTQAGGRPHAETTALAMAGQRAKGATAYVTLEPCAHHAKTPPCADALIQAGITRCVIAASDPDPRVAGKGTAMLRAAGIAVDIGCLNEQANADHAGFFSRINRGRPSVTLKLATTLDGRIALENGQSQWITGAGARRHVHIDRACHDAILVGGGTVRADDPQLTVRGLGISHQPLRIVVSTALNFQGDGLRKTMGDAPLVLAHGADAPQSKLQGWDGAKSLCVKQGAGGLDLNDLMQQLGDHGLTSVYVEGGGKIAASLLMNDLVDDLVLYSAGKCIGADGLPAIAALGLNELAHAQAFELTDHRDIGGDIRSHWRRKS